MIRDNYLSLEVLMIKEHLLEDNMIGDLSLKDIMIREYLLEEDMIIEHSLEDIMNGDHDHSLLRYPQLL